MTAHFLARAPYLYSRGNLLSAANDPRHMPVEGPYNDTKLLVVLLTRELAQLPEAQGVVVNNAHPGLCRSDVRRDFPLWFILSVPTGIAIVSMS